jgi:NitT/TauT family transport system ATP-binding protein
MRLIARGVTHGYGPVPALDGVDLELGEGEIVCVVGPSGCGKSTLLRLLAGLERPDKGEVLQAGAPPAASLNPVTTIFQDFALLPWRTAAGNVALVLEHHPLAPAERRARVAAALAKLGLADFAAAYPRQLSGGMKQRVAIARALVVEPAILLLDEPLSALDAQTRELLLDELVALWTRERFAAVYVTHNLAEAVRLGHRVVVLSRRPGRVRAVLPIETPLGERTAGAPELERLARELWAWLRDEASAADRELVHG